VPDLGARSDGIVQVADTGDAQALAEAACHVAGGRPAGLLSWYDGTMVATARAAELLDLPTPPATALQRARHKYSARRAMRAAGLPAPAFALIGAAEEADRVAAEVGLPAIIKPVNGTASSLVRRVTDVAGLAAAYRELAAHAGETLPGLYGHVLTDPDTGARLDPARTFLVEGLLAGPEYSADVIVRDGMVEHVVLLDKFLIDDDFFERGFCWPPLGVDADKQARIYRAVDGAVRALDVDNTTAHVEVRDDPLLGPTVVEVNAGRPGGQIIGVLAALGTGIDLRAEHLALALGAPRPDRGAPRLPPPLATLTVFGDRSGRLVRIDGLDEAAEHPDVMAVVPFVSPGDHLDALRETFPVNFLVAGLETRDELVATYKELAEIVHLVIEPDPTDA
ncbi:MAG: ATP-grasp domain-containing protein, partial [Actinocatenispora sp.]